MARIRTVKPEFFTSEDIVEIDPLARLLYIALWCEADKEGRFAWKPKTFKMRYLPADKCDIDALCDALLSRGLVVMYGEGYAFIPTFKSHQHINPREKDSALPVPTEENITRRARVSDESVTHREEGRKEGKEGKGKELDAPDKPARFDAAKMDLPDCVPRQAWIEWISYRRERRLAVSETTMRKQIESLENWHAEGHNVGSIISTSITNGWQGIFQPKDAARPANGVKPKDPRFHLDSPEYRAQIAAEAEKYRGNYTEEQLARAHEPF